jgi:hypothetical protein
MLSRDLVPIAGIQRRRVGLQNCSPVHHPGKVGDRFFIDSRWLRRSRLLNFRQIAAGQESEEAGCHKASKRKPKALANPLDVGVAKLAGPPPVVGARGFRCALLSFRHLLKISDA